jgi:hypothetical protein
MVFLIPIFTALFLLLLRLYLRRPIGEEFKGKVLERSTAEEFAFKYKENGSYLKGGTLCFYGYWFGKPYDNFHKLVRTNYDKVNNTLRLTFNENEILTIYNPTEIEEYPNRIIIKEANRINWQWHIYSEKQTGSNLYFIEINRAENQLQGKTNVTWYEEKFETLDINKPAVLWIE